MLKTKTTINPWLIPTATNTATIKALGDIEIEYRQLTMIEIDTLNLALMGTEVDDKGQPKIDYSKASKIKYEKVAMMVVNPPVTVAELQALPNSMRGAIDEILALIDTDDDAIDEEGN